MNTKKTVAVVIPVFNEAKVLKKLTASLISVLEELAYGFEVVFVNDGSFDGSLGTLLELAGQDKRVKVIDLSRNFGQQQALSAGLDLVKTDAVIMMDADLEDRPEDIPLFIKKWEQGFDVVYAIRKKRDTTLLRSLLFSLFHWLNKKVYQIPIEPSGIFGLIDSRALAQIRMLRENNRYLPGLRSWVGFKQIGIELDRPARYDNKPRVKFDSLLGLALNSYCAFSIKPLRLASVLGIVLAIASLIAAVFIVIFQLIVHFKVPGWASIVALILFLSSMQFICMGIIGEYLGRVYEETKKRPLYVINQTYGFDK